MPKLITIYFNSILMVSDGYHWTLNPNTMEVHTAFLQAYPRIADIAPEDARVLYNQWLIDKVIEEST